MTCGCRSVRTHPKSSATFAFSRRLKYRPTCTSRRRATSKVGKRISKLCINLLVYETNFIVVVRVGKGNSLRVIRLHSISFNSPFYCRGKRTNRAAHHQPIAAQGELRRDALPGAVFLLQEPAAHCRAPLRRAQRLDRDEGQRCAGDDPPDHSGHLYRLVQNADHHGLLLYPSIASYNQIDRPCRLSADHNNHEKTARTRLMVANKLWIVFRFRFNFRT